MESLAKSLNQQGFRCHALDRKVKVELGSFGQFVYIVKDYQSGCYIVQSHLTIQLISFVLCLVLAYMVWLLKEVLLVR